MALRDEEEQVSLEQDSQARPDPREDVHTEAQPAETKKSQPRSFREMMQNFWSGGSRQATAPAPDTAAPQPPPSEARPPDNQEDRPAGEDEVQVDENARLKSESPLYELYRRRQGLPPDHIPGASFQVSLFLEESEEPNEELRNFLADIERQAKTVLQKTVPGLDKKNPDPPPPPAAPPEEVSPSDEAEPEEGPAVETEEADAEGSPEAEAGEGQEGQPEDAAEAEDQTPQKAEPEESPDEPFIEEQMDFIPLVKVTKDKLAAYLFMLPPAFGGKEAGIGEVQQALMEAGVVFGLNEVKLDAVIENQQYFKLIRIADGFLPVDGDDGSIKDHYDREVEIHLTVKDDNTIDYKDLGWLQTVNEGDVICDIIPPTKSVPGRTVFGGEVRGRDGKKASVPKGQNTKTDEEGNQLIAMIDGVISFDMGRFNVSPLLIIEGNVQTEVGNLDMQGDVLIHGDVMEGFTVEATGNITVQGMVEGAKVIAGGDIQVGRGMNGNSHGVMQAKGEVRSKFIENATVTAGGKITCDTIINSTVSSDSSIHVDTGKGAIIGGSITALESISALSIGNQSNRNIVITMGSTANLLHDKRDLEERRAFLEVDIEEIEKNISFLDAGATNPAPELKTLQDDLNLKLTVQRMQLSNIERRLTQLQKKQTDNSKCRLRAEIIYPPAQVTIGSITKILRQMAFSAVVYLSNGEIHVTNV